jgi:hypothetical protein
MPTQEGMTMSLKFIIPERILLTNQPEHREQWVQERIAEDTSILGLSDLAFLRTRSEASLASEDLACEDDTPGLTENDEVNT